MGMKLKIATHEVFKVSSGKSVILSLWFSVCMTQQVGI